MKLEPKAKPVRIRIKSGGEEHSTLESLKKNFSVRDLSDAVEDKRLSRWLKQQNQNELAEGVLRYQGRMKSLSDHDYLDFIKLFFANEPNIETVTDDCSLAAFFHGKWKKSFERVLNRCCESKGFTAIHYFYRTYKDEKTTDSWIKHFEGLKDSLEPKDMANCLSELAILYGERNMPIKKIRSLCSAIALGSKDAERELQNMTKSNFGVGANALNSPNDWLNLLENYQRNVSASEKCNFLRDLSTAYNSMGDLYRAELFLLESAKMGDKESIDCLLEYSEWLLNDSVFRIVKTLYETNKDIYAPNEWVKRFEIIENKVGEIDKIEYYTSLYRQCSSIGNMELAEKYRKDLFKRKVNISIGVRDNINPEKSLYPKFSDCLNRSIKKYDIENLCRIDFSDRDAQSLLFGKYVDIAVQCCKNEALTVAKMLSLFSYINNMFEYYFKGNEPCLKLHSFLECFFEEYFFGRKNYYGERQGKLGYFRYKYPDQDVYVYANNGFSCPFPKIIDETAFIQIILFAMETCGNQYTYKLTDIS